MSDKQAAGFHGGRKCIDQMFMGTATHVWYKEKEVMYVSRELSLMVVECPV